MSEEAPRFGRVMTAMVTPMTSDGAVDLDAAARLARWLVEQGNEALVVCGTTGESATLTHDEKLSVISAVVQAVTVPVIAGTTGPDTAASVALSREAEALGVAAILSLCPYYNRPSQNGIAAHLAAVAEATDLANVIYDIPIRTGRKISTSVLIDLAASHHNVVGLKDAAQNPAETARLIAAVAGVRADFEVYSGDDSLTLPLLSVGACGVIGVATHWSAPEHAQLMAHYGRGEVVSARQVNQRLLESFAFESSDDAPNPIPTKAMLRAIGHPVGECRPPMGPAPAGLEEHAAQVYARLEVSRG
jgi:4-hydroxy-tetrahydrodipicolinate synthase